MQNMKNKATALLLLVAALLSALLLSSCGNKENEFFLKENMADYISLTPEDYQNVALTVDGIAEITEADVNKYVMQAYASYLESQNKTETKYDGVIQKGDTVTLWYRGEVNMAADGQPEKWVDFIGGCNFYPGSTLGSPTAASLLIGGGQFIPGFEDALIGLSIDDCAFRTVSDKQNYVGKEGLLDIVHVTYSYEYRDENGNKKTGQMFDRVDLRKDGDGYLYTGRYSDALRDALAEKSVGDLVNNTENNGKFSERFDLSGDLKEEDISVWNVRVISIVKADTPLSNATVEGAHYTFEVSFPNPYTNNPALAGKKARWYAYVTEIRRPVEVTVDENVVLTAKEVTDVLGITFDNVKPFLTAEEATAAKSSTADKEAALVKYYKKYIEEGLKANREQTLQANVIDALWRHIVKKVELIKWPEGMVDRYVDTLYAEAENAYAEYTSQNGQNVYPTLEDYVVNQYTNGDYFPTPDKVAEGFRRMAEDQLKQEMAVHYIAAAQGLAMSKKEQKRYYNEQLASMLEYYNTAYAQQIAAGQIQPFTKDDLVGYGYTKQTVVSNYYYEKVSLALYDEMMENETVTFDLPSPSEGEE